MQFSAVKKNSEILSPNSVLLRTTNIERCIVGFPGAPGPQGLQGARGDPGVQGLRGWTGSSGATGATGFPGPGGFGVLGATGATGPSGFPGGTGAPGPSGFLGATGWTGGPGFPGRYLQQFIHQSQLTQQSVLQEKDGDGQKRTSCRNRQRARMSLSNLLS